MQIQMDIAALNTFIARDFPQLGSDFVIEEITPMGLRLRLAVSDRHLRPGGTVSGPSMFALADLGAYFVILSRIGPVALAVTTNCSMDFVRKPAAGVDLICDVRLLKLGARLAVTDMLIYSQGQPDPVARANMTYAIPPKDGVK